MPFAWAWWSRDATKLGWSRRSRLGHEDPRSRRGHRPRRTRRPRRPAICSRFASRGFTSCLSGPTPDRQAPEQGRGSIGRWRVAHPPALSSEACAPQHVQQRPALRRLIPSDWSKLVDLRSASWRSRVQFGLVAQRGRSRGSPIVHGRTQALRDLPAMNREYRFESETTPQSYRRLGCSRRSGILLARRSGWNPPPPCRRLSR